MNSLYRLNNFKFLISHTFLKPNPRRSSAAQTYDVTLPNQNKSPV